MWKRCASVAHFERVASDPGLEALLIDKEQRKANLCQLYDPASPVGADRFKEEDRATLQRTVFDFARWQTHRSTRRYLRHTLGAPLWRMVRQLAIPLAYVFAVSILVCSYQAAREAGRLPAGWPNLQLDGREPFALMSFALSLLLVFRTNSSYSRWLDARKTWGLVLNRSRDFVTQALTWVPVEAGAVSTAPGGWGKQWADGPGRAPGAEPTGPDLGQLELRAAMCRWAAAFPCALKCHLRVGCRALQELEGTLLPQELDALASVQHKPNFILLVLSGLVGRAGLPPAGAFGMQANLTAFADCLGTCERILKTPIPLSYTRHTSRFMMIWLTLVPPTLWETCGWATVPLCVLIALLLLGIDEIGVSLEEPFSILALDAIADTAHGDILQLQRLQGLAGECWRARGRSSSGGGDEVGGNGNGSSSIGEGSDGEGAVQLEG